MTLENETLSIETLEQARLLHSMFGIEGEKVDDTAKRAFAIASYVMAVTNKGLTGFSITPHAPETNIENTHEL